VHEVALAQAALDVALARTREAGASRIHVVTLRVGALACVEPDALSLAFDVVTRGTAAEDAELHIEDVPALCWCERCGREFEPCDWVFCCPDCGTVSAHVRAGRELTVASLEIS
jgi:hydrogenase nickel incorporation protein HypA/HybF